MQQKKKKRTGERESGAQSRVPVAAVVTAAVIAAVLLTPCALAAASNSIYPRTTVAGIAVGGMSRAEAQETLEQELSDAYADKVLSVTVQGGAAGEDAGGTYEIALSDIGVTADAQQAAEAAWSAGRSGNFFTGGVAYVQNLLLGRTVEPELTFDEEAVAAEAARIAEEADVPVTECSWRLDGETLYITKPASGYLIDQTALVEQVEQAVAAYDLGGVTCALEEEQPISVSAEEIYNDAHKEASNAYYDKTTGTVKEGENGVEFDADEVQTLLDQAEPGEEVSLSVTITEPEIDREEMSKYLFRDKLGTCTTNVSGTANRKHNVSLAAQSCNSIVLNPGETFSYNSTLGERTAARGYLPAGAYVNGKTVEEYGGGICQVSSTLYLAVLRSDLEIVTRSNHMFYPGYIAYGMDATVSWGGPDFQFKNNTDYPIKIVASYSGGKAVCTIYGTNLTGKSVKMEYNILSTTAYETVEKEDSTLAPGTRQQEQSGYTGYEVVTYRCVYDKNGNLVSRTLEAKSTYKSRDCIILVGPASSSESESGGTTEEEETPTESGETESNPETPAQSEETESTESENTSTGQEETT